MSNTMANGNFVKLNDLINFFLHKKEVGEPSLDRLCDLGLSSNSHGFIFIILGIPKTKFLFFRFIIKKLITLRL